MNLKKFDFTIMTTFDMPPADPLLLEEARQRGFCENSTPYHELFNKIFFSGCTVVWKDDLDPDFKKAAIPYLRSFMASWEPSQEDKESISALLLSELVDLEKTQKANEGK